MKEKKRSTSLKKKEPRTAMRLFQALYSDRPVNRSNVKKIYIQVNEFSWVQMSNPGGKKKKKNQTFVSTLAYNIHF